MTSLQERSGSLNLVVHKGEIERGIRELMYTRYDLDYHYLNQLGQALFEIDRVLASPNSRQVNHYDPGLIPADIGDAEEVMIYGCTRDCCLNWVAQAAIEVGAKVAISIRGSV